MDKYFLIQFYVPFKIISAHGTISRWAKTVDSREKNTWHTRKQKLACLTCCPRGARTHTRHRGQILVCLIHPSTQEAVSPEECVLMAKTAKAIVAFGRICANVYKQNETKVDTKLKVYMAQSTLLYSCVAWLLYQQHSKRSPCLLKVLEKT